MKINLITIGNSKGIRIPQAIIKQYNITESMEMVMMEEGFMLKPIEKEGIDWEKAFKKAEKIALTPNENIWLDHQNSFDKEEWTW
jgi:antitoxin MazE